MTGALPAGAFGRCRPQTFHRRVPGPERMWTFMTRGIGGPFEDDDVLFVRGGGPGFGPGGPGPGFGPRGRGRGRRARRGDIRAAILLLLGEEPRNGYQLMQELEERSGGVWRPSPGSVYPALAQLEDEGLVRSVEHDGRKLFELTDEGRAHVEEHRERLGAPWETLAEGVPGEVHSLRRAVRALFVAASQVSQTGSKAQLEDAQRILDDARRALYRILADDAPEG